ncbi:NXPE family member 3-like [Sardina pilchardus]|uniref:NXPE family member 3-like n=1 Tax=Sardina pilchardus TaxID=27697 RepID=UPI002E12B50A
MKAYVVNLVLSYNIGDTKGHESVLPEHKDILGNKTQKLKIPEGVEDISIEEWDRIQRALQWGGPDQQVTTVNMSTSPDHTTFVINNFKDSYSVGEELHVTIVAKDLTGRPKTYGGDFFKVKVFSPTLQASVFGGVLDHQNGTYLARFTLPWAGEARVAVLLVHTSESVEILKRHRETDPNRGAYFGYFVGKNSQGAQVEERSDCNVKWEGVGLPGKGVCCCEYPDLKAKLTWHCRKPPTLPCNTLVYHGMGDNIVHEWTELEKAIMDRQYVQRWIKGDSREIRVLASNSTIGQRVKCKPGMPTPIPAGFYMKDVWTSFVCATRHFNAASEKTQCLRDKHIYMMGDSTLKQWYDFIVYSMPNLRLMNLHTHSHNGPFLAVDVENNIDVNFRTHGVPRRNPKATFTDMHYISNEIDGMAGGSQTVVIFDIWAHFKLFPHSFFAHRVSQIRRAVVDLLRRAPATKVIIKTANTGLADFHSVDWLASQLDQIMREVFRDVGVYILDVWQMTSCHYNREDVHPGGVIIRNEVDLLLSFICPA